MLDPAFPLLTPFLVARDLGKKNPDLAGREKWPTYADPEELYKDRKRSGEKQSKW
jgi:hypothetical protein